MTTRTFTNLIIKFRWAIAILVPVFVLGLSSVLKDLAFEGSYRIWFGEDSKILKDYDNFRAVFGNDDGVVITFKKDEGIFTKDNLAMIDRVTEKLWQTKFVARVDSLTNYQYVYANPKEPDDIIVEDFIQNIQNATVKYLEDRKSIAVNDSQIVDSIISKDGKTTMIVARLTPGAGDNEDVSFELMEYIENILDPERERGYKFHLSGGPVLTTSFVSIAQHDGIFVPIVLIVVMVLLIFVFRKFSGAILPLGVVVLTFLVILSIQLLLGYKLNNFTANMPVFITAIGIADAMHIYWVWMIYRKEGMKNIEAIHESMQKNLLPAFLTSITTAVGFASLSISEVIPVKTLGIATACAAVLAFVLTILFIPALLAILNPKIKKIHSEKSSNKRSSAYTDFIIKYDKKILLATITLFAIFGLGLIKAKVDSNTIKYFDENYPVRVSANFIQKNITGSMSYEIIVDSKIKGGAKEPEFLKKIEQFSDEYVERFEAVTKTISLLDVIKRYNKIFHEGRESYEKIPDSRELIAQFLLLYSLSLPQGMEINDKIDINEQSLRITARVNIVDTSKDLEMISWVQKWWKNTPYSATVSGQNAMFAYMQKNVTDTLIYSISIALTLVSLLMFIIFRDIKMTAIFLLPNILPLVLVIGIMGWMHIYIDIGIAVTAAIILGVAVDDTIHFFSKYKYARDKGEELKSSLDYVIKYAGGAIFVTTIILSLSFLVLIFSDFKPNYNFAIVTGSALFIALIADLVMLPALFSLLEKKKS